MFDFPNSPTSGQQVTGANGAIYQWDGAKWVPTGSSGGVSSFNARTGAVTLASGDVTGALTYTPYNSTNPAGYQTAAQVTASLGGYLPLAGGAMSGQLSIPAVANLALGGGTLGQVLTTNGAGSLSWTTVAGTLVDAPSDGQYYSRRNAGWAVSPGGLVDAPVDGALYARKSGVWSHVTHSDITDWATYVPVASSTTPLMDGTAAVGAGTTYARADHVHPTDTSLYSASNPAGYQTAAQVGASISAAAYTLPTASTTVLGGVKVDGSSITIASGVISSVGGGGIADAPNDATAYARKGLAWSHLTHGDITDWAANVPAASAATPIMDGTAAIGVGTAWARADHVHPSDTSRAPVANPTFTGTVTIPAGWSIAGVANASNAAAGQIGEVLAANLGSASPVTLTTTVPANIASIALTAGDWDVTGEVWFTIGSGGATQIQAGINSASAVIPSDSSIATSQSTYNAALAASVNQVAALRPARVSLSAPATYYLVGKSVFPSGTTVAFGNIIARRMR